VWGLEDPASAPANGGEEAKVYLPHATQVLVPGAAHTPENDCTRAIRHQLFRTGSTHGLDVGCVGKLKPLPFKLPVGPPKEK
jgi:hypothetical protein